MSPELWLSIIFGVCLVIMIKREAKYIEITEKTILLLRELHDANLRNRKELIDLIANRLPHLMPQVNEILKREKEFLDREK